jgi:hypothetical protein
VFKNTLENSDLKFGISMEVVLGEPLNEEEMDHLALLFAKAIVRKMLSKEKTNVRKISGNINSEQA